MKNSPGEFATKLKKILTEKGFTINFVEEQTEIPYVTLWTWINGRRVPSKYTQNMLFEKLDTLKIPEIEK